MRSTAFLILPMTLLLTACDPESSNEVIVVKFVCLKIKEYDQKTQDRALAELEALPKGSALREFIGDYKFIRDKVRECRAKVPT